MKTYNPEMLRNIAIIGHGSTGKTSLSEAMIYCSGGSNRLGRVEDGNSLMDFEPEEVNKTASISTAFGYVSWNKTLINIADTPGDSNFIGDAINVAKTMDCALMTICAASGVEVQTEKFWELTNEHKVPKILFINKMDRERANFDNTLQDIKNTFKVSLLPLQIPIGQEESFTGVVDLISQKAYSFDDKGNAQPMDIPGDMADRIEEFRTEAIEAIAENDEELMDKYLEGEELPMEKVNEVLKQGVASGEIIPILCGSATKCIGISNLLDFLVASVPPPVEHAPFVGTKPGSDDQIERKTLPDEPFSGIVLKTVIDPYAGKLNIFRVVSGSVNADSGVFNATSDTKERLGQILKLLGKKTETIETAVTGDIVAVAKLKKTNTGDTLCEEKAPVIYDLIEFPNPSLSYAIQATARGDEDKIVSGLMKIAEEDPTLKVSRNLETSEILVSGMGTGHLDVAVSKLKRKFNVDVRLQTPKVPYKETVKGTSTVRYRHKKQSGGRGQFGECQITMSPNESGGGYEFIDKIFGGAIPRQFIPAVDKGITETMNSGILAGYPVVDFKIELIDGKHHPVDSSENAFKMAGSKAFKQAMSEAKPTLLEPINNMEIIVPEENTGDIMGDLSGRRGAVQGYETKGKNTIIKAQVPLAEVLKYEPELRSMTSGKGNFTSEFSHYQEVPHELQVKIVDAAKKDEEE